MWSLQGLRQVTRVTRNRKVQTATIRLVLAAFLAVQVAALSPQIEQAIRLENEGKSAEALTIYKAAAATAAPGSELRALALDGMSGIETDNGEYKSAIEHASAAAAIFKRRADTQRAAVAVNRIGLAHLYAGEYRDALPLFQEAIGGSTTARDEPAAVEATSNLGNVLFFLGRYGEAELAYASAMTITKQNLPAEWAQRRRRLLLVNQATLDQRLGRDEEALTHYQEMGQGGGSLRPREQAQILTNLGVLYRRLGDPVKALKSYDEARALFAREGHLDGELGVMKNRGIVLALDLGQLDAARQNFSDALARATRVSNRREMLQAQLYRGETELRLGDIAAARADFTETLAAARALNTPEEQWKSLFGLARVELRANDRDAAVTNLEQAIGVIEGIREAIRVPTLRSDYFNDKREVYDTLIDLELETKRAARVFELMERSRSRVWRDRLGLTSDVSLAAIQRSLPRRVLLIETWSSKLGSAVVFVTRDAVEMRRESIATKILPAKLLADIDNVIVVPDGGFSSLPFETLRVGKQLLIERAAVSYAPAAAILFRPKAKPRRSAVELRAFANSALPQAANEVRAIAAELGGESILHVGADNRKRYLYDEEESAPLLHIASHAIADETAMERSRIEFASRDDLFLKEAYDLPLRSVELAVLSACETERGRNVTGEGVQSFSRALLAAGARSTVTTLWRVPDAATATFMKLFYHHLQRGESRSEALRRAKLRFLESPERRDPRYWAAFVLTGDALTPIPRATDWRTITMAIALLVVASVGIAALVARTP